MSKAGEVSKLASNGEKGFTDRQVDAVCFNLPWVVSMEVNYEIVVADSENHAIRVVTPGDAVRTLILVRGITAAETHAAAQRLLADDDRLFIVLAESKPSKHHIPVWARYSPLRTRVEAHANTLSP
jgi:hypothetical protein